MAAAIKNTFYKVGDGFIYNTYFRDGDPVALKPGQEKYLVLSGVISDKPKVKPAPAAAPASK